MAVEKKPITVILREYTVEVYDVPHGQTVFVRDYDIEHHWCEPEELHTDGNGNEYFLQKHTAKNTKNFE